MNKIYLHVAIDVRPGKYQDFVTQLKKHIDAVQAEPGCEYIELFQNPDQADVVHVYETWSDRASWDSHMANDRSADWHKTAKDFVFGEHISLLNKL